MIVFQTEVFCKNVWKKVFDFAFLMTLEVNIPCPNQSEAGETNTKVSFNMSKAFARL